MSDEPVEAPAPEPAAAGGNRWAWITGGVIAVIALVAVGAFVLGGSGDDDAADDDASQEVFLEPVDHVEDPFTPSVGKGTDTVATTTTSTVSTTGSTTTSSAPKAAVAATRGGLPGLYGGTRDAKTCDKEKLVTFLEQNESKGRAWAKTLGIPYEGIREYVAGLTPVLLRSDTRVTNHGYRDGKATSRQAVLQAGTAVLVDQYGRPVTKCACGNPLTAPVASKATYTGDPWPSFEPANITVVVQNTTVINTFVLIDNGTGDPYGRPAGSSGGDDVDVDGIDDLPPPDDFDPDFCEGPTADPDLCVDLDATTTTAPEAPDASNEAISGPYSFDATATGGCEPYDGLLDIQVTGSSPKRTITLKGPTGVGLTGTLSDELSFEASGSQSGEPGDIISGVTDEMTGKFDLHADGQVTFAATDVLTIEGGGSCTFELTGYLA